MIVFCCIFLSTLPARGATSIDLYCGILAHYFYPRSPRGERLCSLGYDQLAQIFLSTLPARGATAVAVSAAVAASEFLSTLPARGATSPQR